MKQREHLSCSTYKGFWFPQELLFLLVTYVKRWMINLSVSLANATKLFICEIIILPYIFGALVSLKVRGILCGRSLYWLTWSWPLRWTPSRTRVRVPPRMMDHPSDPCDLTIVANHQASLSVTVMIGNDSGSEYSDDGWSFMSGPKRGWIELGLNVYWQHWLGRC